MKALLLLLIVSIPFFGNAQNDDDESVANVWYSTQILNRAIEGMSTLPPPLKNEPVVTTYPICSYRSEPSVLKRNESLALFLVWNKIPLIKNGLNVIESHEGNAVVTYKRRYLNMFGKKVWRLHIYSDNKINRQNKKKPVRVIRPSPQNGPITGLF